MSKLQQNVITYMEQHAPRALAFWVEDGAHDGDVDVVSVCDALYALKLIGRMDLMAGDANDRFVRLLSRHSLAGKIGIGKGAPLSVHQTAYVLGVLNLLQAHGTPCHREILRACGWRKHELLDDRTGHPRWPWYFAHHAWRIGHWIGGIPSIVLSLWRLCPDLAEKNRLPRPKTVLARSDALIDGKTGLLRPYRWHLLQRGFRALYRFRHDPDAGAIGGVAHLHWSNYAAGRVPYVASEALFDRTWQLLQRRPFMEAQPYCLDFDIVQIARTAISHDDSRSSELQERAAIYAWDISDFYANSLDSAYALHKLPGGLAALHESAMTADLEDVPGLAIAPVDIAKEAHWI
ncbi:MAG TPA: hypothetical protein VLT91_09110 [Rhizomicrobium sp.]|nr:hypothetical protein [Rhizomicrobium sp.]